MTCFFMIKKNFCIYKLCSRYSSRITKKTTTCCISKKNFKKKKRTRKKNILIRICFIVMDLLHSNQILLKLLRYIYTAKYRGVRTSCKTAALTPNYTLCLFFKYLLSFSILLFNFTIYSVWESGFCADIL